MSRSIWIALIVSTIILTTFTYLSHSLRTTSDGATIVPSLAAAAAPTDSPLPTPLSPPTIRFRQPTTEILKSNQPTIYLAFDQPMDRASLQQALSITPAVPFEQNWVANTLYLHPVTPLAGATIYTLTVSAAAQSAQGQPLAMSYHWRYRSPTAVTTWYPPTLYSDDAVTLVFTDPIAPTVATFDPPLATTQQWRPDNNQLRITPDLAFSPATTYTIRFADPLLDQDGYAVALPEMRFHTPPLVDTRRTAGSSVNPTAPVTFAFTPLYLPGIDTAATAATLQISPTLTGTVGWQQATLVFTPTQGYLAPQTTYTVTVAPQLFTNGAADPIAWHFTTGDLTNRLNFGMGTRVQVVAPSGPRTLYFQRTGQPSADYTRNHSAERATFTLQPLTVAQMQQALARLDVTYIGNNTRLLDEGIVQAAPVATWSTPLRALTALEQQSDPYNNPDAYQLATTIPPNVVPGTYLLSMRTGYINDQLLLFLGEQSLLVKQSADELLAWASRFDGSALADTAVLFVDSTGKRVATGATDSTGLFRAPLPADQEPWFALAYDAAGPLALAGNTWSWRTQNSTGQNSTGSDTSPLLPKRYSAYLYTDRPIYRPGQTVHFKGIVRGDDDAVLAVPPPATPVTVQIRNGRGTIVRAYDLDTNALGTFHDDFPLADGAGLGNYTLEAAIGGEQYSQSFQVQTYHKPDFTVDVAVDAPDLHIGAPVTVTVTSHYLNGNPLVDGVVTLNHYFVGVNNAYGAFPQTAKMGSYDGQTATTDAQGHATITFAIGNNAPSLSGWANTVRWAIEATVRDRANQQLSNYALLDNSLAQGQLTMTLPTTTVLPGTGFDLALAATDLLGMPAPYANLQLSVNALGQNGSQLNGQPLRKPGVSTVDLTLDRQGTLQLPLRFDEAGYYTLQLARYDAKGLNINPVMRALLVHDATVPWVERADGFLTITPPDRAFVPGETVPLEIMSSFHALALLTVERGSVRRTLPVELTPPRTIIDLPLLETDAPNLFVTVNAWTAANASSNPLEQPKDYRLRSATTEIAVTPVNKQVTVTITPDRATYAPRDTATLTLRVVDEAGAPVQAELSLALVDEAIYRLSADLLPSLYDTFYGPRHHGIATFDGTAPTRSFGFWGGGGGGGGFDPTNPRWSFPDTALWLPDLTTNANGEATITVPLPDSLTTWRAVVKAVTMATQVGETSATLVTDLPVSVQPIVPTTLTVGDETLLSLLLHNNSTTTQTLTVTVALSPTIATEGKADLLTMTTAATQQVTVAPAHTAVVGWPISVTDAGQAHLLFSATGVGESDAMLVSLTIHPAAIRNVTVAIGDFRGVLTKTVTIAPTLAALSQVRVEVSRSTAGSMMEGLGYLTGYPYGCVEQTMSRALPNAVVGRAFRQLGIGDPGLRSQLPELINAGLQRLYTFQHSDGGWGWWENDNSDEYQTAWVIFGLALTAEAGHEVDTTVIDQGMDYLQQRVATMDPRTRAFALYAITLVDPDAQRDRLVALADAAEQLDPFSQAALALTLHRAGMAQHAEQLLDLLMSTAVTEDNLTHWPSTLADGVYYEKTMASAIRTTALALSALTAIRPDAAQIPAIVRWLMAQRGASGWGTTNETSFALLALTDHLLATEQEATDATFALSLNDRSLRSGTIDRVQPSTVITLTGAELTAGANRLQIATAADTRLYYRLIQSSYDDATLWQPAGPLTVQRAYLDPTSGTPLATVPVGQVVMVQLTVQLDQPRAYMLVEDQLPGGLRAINEQIASEQLGMPGYLYPNVNWGELGYNYKEIREDRVTFFVTDMPAGVWQISYLARAVTPGDYVALPAEAYAMYNLEQWGRSAADTWQVAVE